VRIRDYTTNKLIHEFRDLISSPSPMCSAYPKKWPLVLTGNTLSGAARESLSIRYPDLAREMCVSSH
jgi:hypothetical protein